VITESSVEKFLDDLASGAPTPGGGSAAAIMGAMGAALISMVCNVTVGKQGLEAVAPEMKSVREQSEKLRARLAAMVAEDIAAFDGLMAAYRLPKLSETDKARRTEAIQTSLRAATETPLDCARACSQVIGLAQRAGEAGYSGVISDAGVGVLAAYAALRSAALNVYMNAPALKDREYARQATSEVAELLQAAALRSEAVYALVRGRVG
jgi:formiminotetrahydrofolate cyclodeaminase